MLLPRVLTAIVLLALVSGALFYVSGTPFAVLALCIPVLGAWEWAGFHKFAPTQRLMYTITSLGLGVYLAISPKLDMQWSIVFALTALFWLIVAPVWLRYQWKISNQYVAMLLGWLLLFGAWQGIVLWQQVGPLALLTVMLVVWIADTAAYFTGRAFGRHKLAVTVSPGKTWEGAAGAAIAVAIYALTLYKNNWLPVELPVILLVVVAAFLTAVSIIGDLIESLLKRQAGLKDSGHILPGHGGILDRVDSLIAVLAVAGAARWFWH